MKENSLLKINGRHINQVMCMPGFVKGKNITKQSFKSRDSQTPSLVKLSAHIGKFFDTDTFI